MITEVIPDFIINLSENEVTAGTIAKQLHCYGSLVQGKLSGQHLRYVNTLPDFTVVLVQTRKQNLDSCISLLHSHMALTYLPQITLLKAVYNLLL